MRQDLSFPDTWGKLAPSKLPPAEWWRKFNNQELDHLMDRVLVQNIDLAIASLSINIAANRLDLAVGERRPELAASLNASSGRKLDQHDAVSNSSGSSLSIGYEIDLWGRVAALQSAAEWELLATTEDKVSTRLVLIRSVSEAYFRSVYFNKAFTLTGKQLAIDKKLFNIANSRYRAGEGTEYDVIRAQETIDSFNVQLVSITKEKKSIDGTLRLLLAAPNDSYPVLASDFPRDSFGPALGEAVEILSNRPDVKGAELRLRRLVAEKYALKASYYPPVSLNLALSTYSDPERLKEAFMNPSAALGISTSLPFLNWMKMQSNLENAEAEYSKAALEFRKKVFSALIEIQDLSAERELGLERLNALGQQMNTSSEGARIAEARYLAGETGLDEFLEAQKRVYVSQLSLAEQERELIINMCKLYLAIGAA